jgi:hypothetical protein
MLGIGASRTLIKKHDWKRAETVGFPQIGFELEATTGDVYDLRSSGSR